MQTSQRNTFAWLIYIIKNLKLKLFQHSECATLEAPLLKQEKTLEWARSQVVVLVALESLANTIRIEKYLHRE
jgi:hypothetical protein